MDNFTQDLLKAIALGGKVDPDEIARGAMGNAAERGVNEVVKAELTSLCIGHNQFVGIGRSNL